MKKMIILIMSLLAGAQVAMAQLLVISNVELTYNDDKINVSYDLSGYRSDFTVYVWLDIYRSNAAKVQLKSLSGDVGKVEGNGRKSIAWNIKSDGVNLQEQIYAEVSATTIALAQSESPLGKNLLFPGYGDYAQSGDKTPLLWGAAGYATLGSAVIFGLASSSNFSDYDKNPNKSVYDKAVSQRNMAYITGGIAGAIWLYKIFTSVKQSKSEPSYIKAKNSGNLASAKSSPRYISTQLADVDNNIPVVAKKNPNRYALVIGNEDYTTYQPNLKSEANVAFARADAATFGLYCENTLGVPKENIVVLSNAISSRMKAEIEKLVKYAQYSEGKAELIFYYAGHGFPDQATNEAYIMPVDISADNVTEGIKLSDLYAKLAKYPTEKTMVFLDACFSGGGRNQGLLSARGVKLVPKNAELKGNLVVFSASTGSQVSLPYEEKGHGMFTYYLLKKFQEAAGDVSMKELGTFIKNNVQLQALKVNNKEQNPEIIISPSVSKEWENWKLKDK